ncbi:hypothetical protein RIEGSTA812A_PEG_1046 [invertebrate metagenome]|uniref:Uncharacterized protein n=1 Tax=invertebrate metagenome TaxID=1711999 RepID=A0A484H9Q3_9ZZZZ
MDWLLLSADQTSQYAAYQQAIHCFLSLTPLLVSSAAADAEQSLLVSTTCHRSKQEPEQPLRG